MIVPRRYENLNIMHENTLPPRAYYIPASKRMGHLIEDRESSDRFQILKDGWKTYYYKSIYDFQEKFYENGIAAEDYDSQPYTNVRYPLHAPQESPCGAYIQEFVYKKDTKAPKVYLNFEGVDSSFYVWLNGTYVGYSQVSHAAAEFRVTEKIREGENTLTVLVLNRGNGNYLEDQDDFRDSGIFRDVYLLKRPQKVIFDYFVTTKCMNNRALVDIRVCFMNKPAPVRILMLDEDGKMAAKGILEAAVCENGYTHRAVLHMEQPVLWNPEQPYLYTLILENPLEVITDRIGIRDIQVHNNVVYVNDVPVTFQEVNPLELDPITGPVMGAHQIKRDLLFMKHHNYNAVRASYYSGVPYFYQLCDAYGLFVMDETDKENQGVQEPYLKDGNRERHVEHRNGQIAENPERTLAAMVRTMHCVHRDKNRPCVVAWSMGKECSFGCTFEEALKWTKSFDPGRLTLCECACCSNSRKECAVRCMDYSENGIGSAG